jgi:hypothetical protein
MKRAVFAMVCLLLLSPCTGLSAADRVRITVIPLNYINVSKADAATMTRLLETGIVKTDSFAVIEQAQVGEILAAQEYSLQECTDEKCAVRIGELLAAEQIVLGHVSRIGTKLVMTGKIIDVETGMTVKADKVEAANIETLADQAELLAFMLAGLTYQKGAQQVIARSFGELFVQTSPDDAEVMVNGISRGTSPLLVPRVPVGTVVVEGRKGTLYGLREVLLSGEGLVEVALALTPQRGRFFIKSSEKAVNVWLDGEDLGPLGSGLFKDIAIGDHRLELRGAGLYWQGEVQVTDAGTVTVDAVPGAVGDVDYSLPDDARAEITGPGVRLVVTGSGRAQDLAAGTYRVRVSGENYRTFDGAVHVTKGQSTAFAPELEQSEQYNAAFSTYEQTLARDHARWVRTMIEGAASNDVLFQVDAEQIQWWLDELEAAPYRFEDEERRIQELLAVVKKKAERYELTQERDRLAAESSLAPSRYRGRRTFGWVTLIGGLATAGGAGTSYALWLNTGQEKYATSATICAVAAGILTLLSPISFHAAVPPDLKIEEQIRDLDRRIQALGP